jgi:hypothetical protein
MVLGSAAGKAPDGNDGEIAVVQTLEELKHVDAVGEGDEAVRVGIEMRACPRGSGLLVYCTPVNGKWNVKPPKGDSDEELGPVRVRVVEERVERLKIDKAQRKFEEGKGAPLFVLGVMPRGDCEVQVLGKGDKVLARRKVTVVVRKMEHEGEWYKFQPVGEAKEGEAKSYRVEWQQAGPRWDGAIPRQCGELLPTFVPQKADPGLKVSMKAGELTVKSEQWASRDFEHHWLARWWVNGKPAPLDRIEVRAVARKELENLAEKLGPVEFKVKLEVDRKMLGAKEGDQVEFQLLYCGEGTLQPGMHAMHDMHHAIVEGQAVRMSARMKWAP